MFDILLALCRLDYVGTDTLGDSTLAVQEVCKEITAINQQIRGKNGQRDIICPEAIFGLYMKFTPSLPNDTTLWTVRLCSQYYNALTNDLKDRMINDGFTMPQLKSDHSKSAEINALREVRMVAVQSYKQLRNELKLIERYMNATKKSKTVGRVTGKHLLTAALLDDEDYQEDEIEQGLPNEHPIQHQYQQSPPAGRVFQYSSVSPAEATMQRYSSDTATPNTNAIPIPTRRGPGGKLYPYHPEFPERPSKFPIDFIGCFKCGSTELLRQHHCKRHLVRGSKEYKDFLHDLWAHKPHTKKASPQIPQGTVHTISHNQQYQSPLPSRLPPIPAPIPAKKPSHTEASREIDNRPAWMSKRGSQAANISEREKSVSFNADNISDEDNLHRGRFYVYFGHLLVSNAALPSLRPMPLGLDNNLPGIVIRAGTSKTDMITFLCHVDSCAAMNTGNLLLHQYVMMKNPSIVAEYCQYDDNNPFQPIHLQVAINDKDDKAPTPTDDVNKLTAVVRYYTPYTTKDGKPVLLSFGLGSNVAVRTIIGLPTLKAWGGVMDFVGNKFIANNLQKRFDLVYEETQQGLPPGASFSEYDFQRAAIQPTSASAFSITVPSIQQRLLQSSFTDHCESIDRE